MIRRLAAGLIVVGLAVGIWALWPRDDQDPSPTTTPTAAATTSTSIPTTSTTAAATTTQKEPAQVVESVEEVEEILRNLWFGWFEGIYNQDEDRIREVVGTQAMLDNARSAFGQMQFSSTPSVEGIQLTSAELLRADEDCLALWSGIGASFRDGSSEGAQVARWDGSKWLLVSVWRNRNDLWGADCDSELEPLS